MTVIPFKKSYKTSTKVQLFPDIRKNSVIPERMKNTFGKFNKTSVFYRGVF